MIKINFIEEEILELKANLILAEAGFDKCGREVRSTNYAQQTFDERVLSYEPTREEARNGGKKKA